MALRIRAGRSGLPVVLNEGFGLGGRFLAVSYKTGMASLGVHWPHLASIDIRDQYSRSMPVAAARVGS